MAAVIIAAIAPHAGRVPSSGRTGCVGVRRNELRAALEADRGQGINSRRTSPSTEIRFRHDVAGGVDRGRQASLADDVGPIEAGDCCWRARRRGVRGRPGMSGPEFARQDGSRFVNTELLVARTRKGVSVARSHARSSFAPGSARFSQPGHRPCRRVHALTGGMSAVSSFISGFMPHSTFPLGWDRERVRKRM